MPSPLRTARRKVPTAGRAATALVTALRSRISEGRILAGQFLPTERELSAEHGLARMTVRRALRALERDGLVAIEPRHGCRVLSAYNDPRRGCPVAHVFSTASREEQLDPIHQHIHLALREVLAARGWSMLEVHMSGRPGTEVLEQLRTARAWGMIVDAADPKLLALIRESGMPAVLVDAWSEESPLDAVLQNSYQGGFLAAQHLLARGHRKIVWFGPVAESSFSRERFGGAAAAIGAAGLELPLAQRVDTEGGGAEALALKLLSRRDRPRAVLALWGGLTVILAATARKLGLVLGKDLDLVGWAIEEQYDGYAAAFAGGPVPPTVVWSSSDMARMAVARLSDRMSNPKLPPMRIDVAARLRT
jgi:DNA-binding LacI/PurR family transcriptional regulator